jgi:uncharacterized protein YcaQ
MTTLTVDSVNRLGLHKQHLMPEEPTNDVPQVVHDIVALHATGPLSPYLSLWSRMKGFTAEQLDRELYERRRLVRVTCMRATLHVVPSQRLPVFFQATKARQRRNLRQLGYLLVQSGLSREGQEEAAVMRLRDRIAEVVADRGASTVAELSERIPELRAKFHYAPDKPYGGQFSVGSQLVPWMCILGLLVRTRPRGSWRSNLYEYAPLAAWLPDVDLEAVTVQEAQVQLIRWYLAAFGPATVEDMAWWSGLSKGQTRKALQALGDRTVEVTIQGLGAGYVMLNDDLQLLQETKPAKGPVINLLPSLDPYIMGYRDRTRFLEPERRQQVFDRAGNAIATVWVDGRVVGAWQEQESGIELLVWEGVDSEAMAAEGRRMARFLSGEDAEAVVKPYPPDGYVRSPFKLGRRR